MTMTDTFRQNAAQWAAGTRTINIDAPTAATTNEKFNIAYTSGTAVPAAPIFQTSTGVAPGTASPSVAHAVSSSSNGAGAAATEASGASSASRHDITGAKSGCVGAAAVAAILFAI